MYVYVISAKNVQFIATFKTARVTCHLPKIIYAIGFNKKYIYVFEFDQKGNAMRRGIHLTCCVFISVPAHPADPVCSNIQYATLESPLLAIFVNFLARYMRVVPAGKGSKHPIYSHKKIASENIINYTLYHLKQLYWIIILMLFILVIVSELKLKILIKFWSDTWSDTVSWHSILTGLIINLGNVPMQISFYIIMFNYWTLHVRWRNFMNPCIKYIPRNSWIN